MEVKKIQVLVLFSFIFMCVGTGQIFGQNKIRAVGYVVLEVNGKWYSSTNPKTFLDVPVNEKFPILKGQDFSIEVSHGDSCFISSTAVADKENSNIALMYVSMYIEKFSGGTKLISKKIKVEKGKSQKFKLKYNEFYFEIIASYKSENK